MIYVIILALSLSYNSSYYIYNINRPLKLILFKNKKIKTLFSSFILIFRKKKREGRVFKLIKGHWALKKKILIILSFPRFLKSTNEQFSVPIF